MLHVILDLSARMRVDSYLCLWYVLKSYMQYVKIVCQRGVIV